jgi:hypothetical protein
VKTGVRLEGRPRDSTRAAARTVVPGAGSGSRITIASPGATRCAVRVASLSKSPGWLVLGELDLEHAESAGVGRGARRHERHLQRIAALAQTEFRDRLRHDALRRQRIPAFSAPR